MMIKKIFFLHWLLWCCMAGVAQIRWQQKVKYIMDVRLDVNTNKLSGKQQLHYTNNSPDTLYQLFYQIHNQW